MILPTNGVDNIIKKGDENDEYFENHDDDDDTNENTENIIFSKYLVRLLSRSLT